MVEMKHEQQELLLLLFLTLSGVVLDANPVKLVSRRPTPQRTYPPSPHAAGTEEVKKLKHKARAAIGTKITYGLKGTK